VAARGGLQAWRGVQTMLMQGRLGAGGNRRATIPVPVPDQKSSRQALPTRPAEEVQLPFVMELKRPGKMRMELQFNGQTAIQVYDGANGWKLRPFLNRRVVEPYTTEGNEDMVHASRRRWLLGRLPSQGHADRTGRDGEGEDRDTYKLKLTMKNGQAIHDWIDAQTFLEAKVEGQPRRLDGVSHPVEVYYRDYRPIAFFRFRIFWRRKFFKRPERRKGLRTLRFRQRKSPSKRSW